MTDFPRPTQRKRNKHHAPRRLTGYTNISPAVCVVMYDLAGRPMPDLVQAEFVNMAAGIAAKYGYVISVTDQ